MKIPPDVARVLEDHRLLGEAARRSLFLAERRTAWEVRQAALRAAVVARRLRPARR